MSNEFARFDALIDSVKKRESKSLFRNVGKQETSTIQSKHQNPQNPARFYFKRRV